MAAKKKSRDDKIRIAAENRKARYSYEIMDQMEAGIALQGTEVKSLREASANIRDSYADIKGGEAWLVNAHIPVFSHGNKGNHEPRRPRKLLLHKRQIEKLGAAIQRQGMTVVPLKLYFNARGTVKVELGLAKGKKLHDKRETEKARDWQRDKERLLKTGK